MAPFVSLTSMLKAEFALGYKMHQSVHDLQYMDYGEVKSLCDELLKALTQQTKRRR